MRNPEGSVVPTISHQRQFVFAKRPYLPIEPESHLIKTAIAGIRVDDRRYAGHIHENSINSCRAWVTRAWAR